MVGKQFSPAQKSWRSQAHNLHLTCKSTNLETQEICSHVFIHIPYMYIYILKINHVVGNQSVAYCNLVNFDSGA